MDSPAVKTFLSIAFLSLLLGAALLAAEAQTVSGGRPLIVWWADTSAPAWYQGKAAPSPGSSATVLAIPGSGLGQSPSSLTYSWSVNAEPQPGVSGTGRSSFAMKLSVAENVSHQIDVRITNRDRTITQNATLVLTTRPAELIAYRLHPFGGTDFSNAVSSFVGPAGDIYDFIAVPFFFRNDILPGAVFRWSVNNKPLEGEFARPNVLTIKTVPGQVSANNVNVSAESGAGINKQRAEAFFTANFR